MNKDLPIYQFKSQIVEAIQNHSVVIIEAETGAGKSTQVPQYLLDTGYEVVVTQPRRLAARTVSQRVAEEYDCKVGGIVGYRTAAERVDSKSTKCLFCTDGLALVRELMGQNKGILVLDEVHEWNENMEVLVAWTKLQIQKGADFKLVVMSATMEAEKLSIFFNNAPIISVPGRLFPVEERQPGVSLESDIAGLVRDGRNVLVFQPGKVEIGEAIKALIEMNVPAEILPLHGQLSPEDQAKCFQHYGRPKVVVSTNVAQTSVTIEDVDAVVDSGMERRIELFGGVEGLYLKPISWADAKQRKGRAGRTKPGIYIDHCGAANRPDFPVAEIMRKRLDQTYLRLMIAGFDMEGFEFFHQPNKDDIVDAHKTLVALGCMTESKKVTDIGRLVNRLPVSVQYARILIEADRLGVVDDALTVAAILEQGGIVVPPPSRNRPERPDWRRMVPKEHESDVMGQLAVWKMARTMTPDERYHSGIAMKQYSRAKEVRQKLADAVKRFFQFGSSGKREDILKAACAGMVNHLYKGNYGFYKNGDGVSRQLGTASLVRGNEWLIAMPFDLQIKTRFGLKTLNLIQLASKIDPMWLIEVAPQLVEVERGLIPHFDTEKDSCVSTQKIIFNGSSIKEETVIATDHPNAEGVFLEALTTGQIEETYPIMVKNQEIRNEYERLWIRSGGHSAVVVLTKQDERDAYYQELSGKGIVSKASFVQAVQDGKVNLQNLFLNPPSKEDRDRIERENPETIEIDDQILIVDYQSIYRRENFSAVVEVTKELVCSTGMDKVILPSGRLIELQCEGYVSGSFSELREKIEPVAVEILPDVDLEEKNRVQEALNDATQLLGESVKESSIYYGIICDKVGIVCGRVDRAQDSIDRGYYKDAQRAINVIEEENKGIRITIAQEKVAHGEVNEIRRQIERDLVDVRERVGKFEEASAEDKGEAINFLIRIVRCLELGRYQDALRALKEARAFVSRLRVNIAEAKKKEEARRKKRSSTKAAPSEMGVLAAAFNSNRIR
ncbi:helicase-related protein [Patescibacteria group bacterium]